MGKERSRRGRLARTLLFDAVALTIAIVLLSRLGLAHPILAVLGGMAVVALLRVALAAARSIRARSQLAARRRSGDA